MSAQKPSRPQAPYRVNPDFVYDQAAESFRPYEDQQAVSVFFLSADRGPARIRRR